MLTKLLATKFLAFLTSIGLIAMIASEAFARVSHPNPEHISGHHHGPPVTSSSSVQEPEASRAAASEPGHTDTGTPEEYSAGLELAIKRGWLELQESGIC